jgi:GntR family transcriptional regulator, transcriptional repressor for pyruvate dehydrogenase complex
VRRDPEGARAAMRMHLSGSRERLRRLSSSAVEEGIERTG